MKNTTHRLFPLLLAFLLFAGGSTFCAIPVHQNMGSAGKSVSGIPKAPKGGPEDFSVPEPEVLLLVGGGLLLLSLARKKKKTG